MISAVVINWNGRHYLEDCLTAVLAQEPAPAEVLLVDNHSTDGSREFCAERFPSVRVVDTGYNAGPGYARNMGVTSAQHDRVLLLDNDVVLQPGNLAELTATMDAHPGTALVQARGLCGHDETVIHYDGSELHMLGLLVLHNWFVPRAEAQPAREQNGGLVALCFLADRDRYLAVGGFNADLFILFEDTDLAWRLRMRGDVVRLAPQAEVLHGAGTQDISMRGPEAVYPARRIYLHSRNRWMVLLTCMHWRTLILLLPPQMGYEFAQFVFACAKRHPVAWLHGKWDLLRALPRVWRWRRLAQRGRSVPDRELLVAESFTLKPGSR